MGFWDSQEIPKSNNEERMHRQAGTEKELMEWFDKQNSERKWRISAYLIKSRQPIAEAFRFLKTIDDRGSQIHLVQKPSGQMH